MENEIWKAIPGFEGVYEVSEAGRVRSLDRMITEVNRTYLKRGVMLKPGPSKCGHVSVCLGREQGSIGVHRLVMLAFAGPPPDGHEVLHRNHKPSDNRRSNLKYGTRSENVRMDYAFGTQRCAKSVLAIQPCGATIRFRNITEAAGAYGVGQPAGSMAVKHGYPLRNTKVRLVLCS